MDAVGETLDRVPPALRTLSAMAASPREAPPGGAARVLRGRRPGRPDRRARARATTARPSTCARRSSTTSTSSSSCASAARSSSTSSTTRSPRARRPSSPPTASRRPSTPRPSGATSSRSTRPARSSRRSTARRSSSPPRATRSSSSATTATRRSRARWARRPSTSCSSRPRRTSTPRGRRSRQGRLHLADHAVGRRDAHDHQPPARALPEHHRAAHRRHLLRHDEPPGGRQADGAGVRPRARHRLAELLELPAPRRGRARLRRRLATSSTTRRRSTSAGSRASASSASPRARARPRSSSQRLVAYFRERGVEDVSEFEVIQEDVRFMLPKTIRQASPRPDAVRVAGPCCDVPGPPDAGHAVMHRACIVRGALPRRCSSAEQRDRRRRAPPGPGVERSTYAQVVERAPRAGQALGELALGPRRLAADSATRPRAAGTAPRQPPTSSASPCRAWAPSLHPLNIRSSIEADQRYVVGHADDRVELPRRVPGRARCRAATASSTRSSCPTARASAMAPVLPRQLIKRGNSGSPSSTSTRAAGAATATRAARRAAQRRAGVRTPPPVCRRPGPGRAPPRRRTPGRCR